MKNAAILSVLLIAILVGCTDAGIGKFESLGEPHKITLYSGGKEIRTWVSTGYPSSEESSDGFYFKDIETNDLVRVAGDVVIEEVN